MTLWLDLDAVRDICYELAVSMPWNGPEPIPAFDTRYPGKLESCLATPQQSFGGEHGPLLYPTLYDQAAILFYLLSKDHPFLNGNKRIALTCLMVFLFVNGQWLNSDLDALYEFAVFVAGSPGRGKDRVLAYVKQFIEIYTEPINVREVIEAAKLAKTKTENKQ